ncbi:MAG: phosphogluconate dehydrogenase (NAD(+)-dependent, decarboxylating) [Candidatus Acidiferrales bacterium]
MHVGLIGLGRMGAAMAERLLKRGHEVVVYDRSPAKVRQLQTHGARGANSLSKLAEQLRRPRIVWLMVPAGEPVGAVLRQLEGYLTRGDVVLDGGNSFYRDSQARAKDLKEGGIHFLDVGTSGGIRGHEQGYCLMVGGERKAFRRVEPLLRALAPRGGYAHAGSSGAGHFLKMVHNGIEYGLLEAYGEGFEMLAQSEFNFDLYRVAALWNRGSVVRSWLLELAASALAKDRRLRRLRGYVEDSGTGRWTIEEAIKRGVPVPALALALFRRFRSRQEDSFAAKLIAALRQEFGGHAVRKKK